MKKLFLTLMGVVFLAGIVMASVGVQEEGVKINKSEWINFKNGPNVTGDGNSTDVDFSTMTGSQAVTGSMTVSGTVGVGTTSSAAKVQVGSGTPSIVAITTDDDVYIAGNVQVDDVIYTDDSIYNSVIKGGYALCIMGTAGGINAGGGYFGHCTTTPTNGACTCVKN